MTPSHLINIVWIPKILNTNLRYLSTYLHLFNVPSLDKMKYKCSCIKVWNEYLSCSRCKCGILRPESKEQRGENSDFLFLGRTVRADIFGRIFLVKIPHRWQHMSKNVESSVNIINLLSNKYPISMFDIKRWIIATVSAYLFKDLV